jgi:quinoprotein glucose dehydrogenase
MNCKWITTLTCLVAAGVKVVSPGSVDGGQSDSWQSRTTWSEYGGGADRSHYSALAQINRKNVAKLEVAWTYPADAAGEFSPIVVGNLAYVVGKGGSIVALDAATGKEVWMHSDTNPDDPAGGGARVGGRGLEYWESKDGTQHRLVFAVGTYLEEIDARTGDPISSFGKDGRVDLRVGLNRDPNSIARIASGTPGVIYDDLIIEGSATGEQYAAPPGDVRAYNILTGELVWAFHTIPHPGDPGYGTWEQKDAWTYVGGADAWGEMTVDPNLGMVYIPTADAKAEWYGGGRLGDDLFSCALLALNARTGKLVWYYQLVHHDIWDYDAVAAPQLVTILRDSKPVKAVAQAGKTGFLYVFDRATGKPIWPIEERPVPQTAMPGEETSPTQPFPTAPPPFARQSFTVNDIDTYFLTPEERAYWKDRVASSVNEGLFTPPAYNKDTVFMPGHNGGANFFGSASNPEKGLVYAVTKNVPGLINVGEPGHPDPIGADSAAHVGHGGAAPFGGGLLAGRGRGNAPAAAPSQDPVELGRTVFMQNCQGCHGADMKGTAAAPSLEGAFTKRGHDGIVALIRQGSAPMPPFTGLTDAEVNGLLALLGDPSAKSGPPARGLGTETFPPYPPGVPNFPRFLNNAPIGGLYPTIITPPWSTLTAYDLNTGKIAWQVPYGDADDYEQPGPNHELRGNIFQKSGPAITAGGLIFYASNEARLRMLNSDTGQEARPPIDLPRGSQGIPAVYEADGREFVLFNATGGPVGIVMTPPPIKPETEEGAYVAFALPKGTK